MVPSGQGRQVTAAHCGGKAYALGADACVEMRAAAQTSPAKISRFMKNSFQVVRALGAMPPVTSHGGRVPPWPRAAQDTASVPGGQGQPLFHTFLQALFRPERGTDQLRDARVPSLCHVRFLSIQRPEVGGLAHPFSWRAARPATGAAPERSPHGDTMTSPSLRRKIVLLLLLSTLATAPWAAAGPRESPTPLHTSRLGGGGSALVGAGT